MSMDIRESVIKVRDMLAPHLDEYSLELLDIEIDEQDWDTAYSMAMQAARYHQIELPAELLQPA